MSSLMWHVPRPPGHVAASSALFSLLRVPFLPLFPVVPFTYLYVHHIFPSEHMVPLICWASAASRVCGPYVSCVFDCHGRSHVASEGLFAALILPSSSLSSSVGLNGCHQPTAHGPGRQRKRARNVRDAVEAGDEPPSWFSLPASRRMQSSACPCLWSEPK